MSKRLTAKKSGPAPKVSDWAALFDPAYVSRACECVREAVQGAAVGHPGVMGEILRTELMARVGAYLCAHWREGRRPSVDLLAAEALEQHATDLADKFDQGWPFEAADADRVASELRGHWDRFRAEAAAHYVYDVAASKAIAAQGERTPKTNAAGEKLSPQLLAARAKSDGKLPAIKVIAREFGTSVTTVNRVIRAARDAGLMP